MKVKFTTNMNKTYLNLLCMRSNPIDRLPGAKIRPLPTTLNIVRQKLTKHFSYYKACKMYNVISP